METFRRLCVFLGIALFVIAFWGTIALWIFGVPEMPELPRLNDDLVGRILLGGFMVTAAIASKLLAASDKVTIIKFPFILPPWR